MFGYRVHNSSNPITLLSREFYYLNALISENLKNPKTGRKINIGMFIFLKNYSKDIHEIS